MNPKPAAPTAPAVATEPTPEPIDTLKPVLQEFADERDEQDLAWGEQNHPNGTGRGMDVALASIARTTCQRQFAQKKGTWKLILDEEVREAFAESDPEKLRGELVQVGAVVAAWIQAIDRAAAAVEALATAVTEASNEEVAA